MYVQKISFSAQCIVVLIFLSILVIKQDFKKPRWLHFPYWQEDPTSLNSDCETIISRTSIRDRL